MATLTNTKIKDTYDGLLKTTDNDVIGASEKVITDGLGNASVLSIGTASASFSSDIEINGLTVGKGNGNLSTNVAVGVNALDSVTYGVDNTAIGHSTMQNLTLGVDNAAFGTGAMVSTTTGNNNTSIGSASLPQNTTGSSNTAVGLQAMQSNNTGGANTVVGMNALNDNSSGNRNTALGFNSGNGLVNGDDNVYVGYNTDSSATDSSNEIVIGSNTTGNGSNTATYGNTSITGHHFTAGQVNVSGNLAVDSNILVGGNQSILAENNLRFKSSGASYIDHNTVGQSINFRVSSASSLDTTAMTISSNGSLAVDTNTLYVDAANNRVGVGTSSPAAGSLLDVNGDIKLAAGAKIKFNDDRYFSPENNVDGAEISANGIFKVKTGATPEERFRIDSSGNVGIGTSSEPYGGNKLNIRGANKSLSSSAGGNLAVYTSDSQAADKGGSIALGGVYTSTTAYQFAGIAGLKENSTAGQAGGYLALYTTNSSNATLERMRIDSSGNVGIGGSPNDALEVAGNTASAHRIRINNANASGAETLIFTQGSTIKSWIEYNNSTSNLDIWQYTANDIRFGTNNGEKMRIDSSGNVGIGVVPSFPLHLSNTTTPQFVIQNTAGGTNAEKMAFEMGAGDVFKIKSLNDNNTVRVDNILTLNAIDGKISSTGASEGVVKVVGSSASHRGEFLVEGAGQFTGSLVAVPSSASTYNGISASTVGITTSSTPLVFATSNSERMRITSGGDVGINEQNPTATLHLKTTTVKWGIINDHTNAGYQYFQDFRYSGTSIGSISGNNTSTSYNTSSDYRLKENVVAMTGALDRVDALKPSRFNFIGDEKTVDGFLAHEVQAIVPEAVTGEKDAVDEEGNPIYQGIDQSKIVPLLVGAIKELRAEIETLKSQLNA